MSVPWARMARFSVAFLALVIGGQLILLTTPFELHQTVTPVTRAWSLASDLLWLVATLVLMARQPSSRLWVIVLFWTAMSQVWLVGYLGVQPPRPWLEVPIYLLGDMWAAVFVHLVVVYPSGRLGDRIDRRLAVVAYGMALGFHLVALLLAPDPCQPICDNPLGVLPSQAGWDVVRYVAIALVPVVLIAANVELVRHWRRAGPAGRRVLAPLLVATPLWCLGVFAGYFADTFLDEAARDATHSLNLIGILQDALIPVAILVGALQTRYARGNVAQLAVELGRGVPVGRLRDVLARALRDPSLELAFPAPGGDGLVDADGRRMADPDPDRRRITRVEHEGELLAVLIDDPQAVDEDPGLVEAVGSVARLALANERLAAQVRAQLEEVRASRARIVEAADAERRRVERDLHDGAQQRLTALAVRLDVARETGRVTPDLVEEATSELRSAIGEVRDLSRGLHPTILTEAGLGPAIEALVERTEIPVRVVAPDTRYPAPIEAAAYFVVAEALTNVTRYAAAATAEVEIRENGGSLAVRIHDDGRGGADPSSGTGLRGLADRVGALGGRLIVDSPVDAGTTVFAELPLPGGVA